MRTEDTISAIDQKWYVGGFPDAYTFHSCVDSGFWTSYAKVCGYEGGWCDLWLPHKLGAMIWHRGDRRNKEREGRKEYWPVGRGSAFLNVLLVMDRFFFLSSASLGERRILVPRPNRALQDQMNVRSRFLQAPNHTASGGRRLMCLPARHRSRGRERMERRRPVYVR